MRGAHRQAFLVESRDDFGGEDRLELFGVRILPSQVAGESPKCRHRVAEPRPQISRGVARAQCKESETGGKLPEDRLATDKHR
jgi:hypothetical protein